MNRRSFLKALPATVAAVVSVASTAQAPQPLAFRCDAFAFSTKDLDLPRRHDVLYGIAGAAHVKWEA